VDCALQSGLTEPDDGIFYVFYDDNQRIYQPPSDFTNSLPAYSLSENVRNTRSIHSLASRYYGGPELSAVGPEGEPVELVTCKDEADCRRQVIRALRRLIAQERIPAGDIAVLSGRTRTKTELVENGKLGPFETRKFEEQDEKRIVYDSIHRFKGLESPVVVLAELENVGWYEDVLYVALSRARTHLIVVCDPKLRTRIETGE